MNSRRKFGSNKIGNPNYGQEAINFFHKNLKKIYFKLISAHVFKLSTKFSHSIPWPLDLDGHSINDQEEPSVNVL